VSSYVYMKVLEAAPERYDRGIRLLSRGSIDSVYGRIARRVASPGSKILDIGCGTGGVSLACARSGAEVTGIDINAGMLRVAREKASAREMPGRVEFLQLGAMEIEDRFEEERFDAVVSCLAFSELSPEEQVYSLGVAKTRLKKGGSLVIADEVAPEAYGARLLWKLGRFPLAALTYLLTQTSTRPVGRLGDRIREAGFVAVAEERLPGSALVVFEGRKE
jgi:ubiquinone/menaquinone biosynthesis C-methylase UbiE